MTPQQAYDALEEIPPVEIKNLLMDSLNWQAKHPLLKSKPRPIVHASWYLQRIIYGWKNRDVWKKRERGDGSAQHIRTLAQKIHDDCLHVMNR